jgi:hypothetical protein
MSRGPPAERQGDGSRCVNGPQREGWPGEPAQCQVQHPHVGVLRLAEGQHRAVGERAHRGHSGVVGVEHGRARYGRQHIVGVSKTAYVLATTSCLD